MDNSVMNEQDSLKLITDMINKTKKSSDDNGFEPILWGSVVSFCAIITALQGFGVIGKLPIGVWNLIFVAIAIQLVFTILTNKKKKVKSFNDVALSYTWMAFGFSMGILALIVYGLSTDIVEKIPNYMAVRGDFKLGDHFSGIYLLIYGIPTFITGGILKFKPMLIGGIICWVLAIISVFTNGAYDMMWTAIAAICAWLIPGIIVNANYRTQKRAHV